MRFIDSHCHLDFSEFDGQREAIIANAQALGVEQFIVPGISLAQSQQLLDFSQHHGPIHIGAGLHPYFLSQHASEHIVGLGELATAHKHRWCAIGECGLDRSIGEMDKQVALFEAQIALANELALPLIVHHRQSHDLIAASFKRCQPRYGGVIHAFSGSEQVAKYYIKLGFKLGVGGTITYARSVKTQQALRSVAIEHLLLESDAPSMPLCGYQGQINTPERIPQVFIALARLLQCQDLSALSEQLYFNCLAFLRK